MISIWLTWCKLLRSKMRSFLRITIWPSSQIRLPVVTLETKKKTWIATSDTCGKLLSGAAKYRVNKVNPSMILIGLAVIQDSLLNQPKAPTEVWVEKVMDLVWRRKRVRSDWITRSLLVHSYLLKWNFHLKEMKKDQMISTGEVDLPQTKMIELELPWELAPQWTIQICLFLHQQLKGMIIALMNKCRRFLIDIPKD